MIVKITMKTSKQARTRQQGFLHAYLRVIGAIDCSAGYEQGENSGREARQSPVLAPFFSGTSQRILSATDLKNRLLSKIVTSLI